MPQVYTGEFSGGEVSRDIHGQVNTELYPGSAAWFQNFISRQQGPGVFRGGSKHVHHTRNNQICRQEIFRFNDEQVYILEFTALKLRIIEDSSLFLNTTSKSITAITQANPGVISSTAHGYSDGDEVYLESIVGMTELNDRFVKIANSTANTYEIQDLFGNNIDTSSFTAYSSGGTAKAVFELDTPFTEEQLSEFDFAQAGNEMYFAHRSHAPRKLIRVSATSFTFGTYSRTADPFGSVDNYPGTVTLYESRTGFASTNTNPDTLWLSRSPESNGTTRYDDYSIGSGDADNAIIAPITSADGSVQYINWIAATIDFIAVGTEGGVSRADGGGPNTAITPSNIRVRPSDPYGVSDTFPVPNGSTIFYMQKGNRNLRGFEYDLLADSFRSFNASFVSAHITKSGVKQLAFQRGRTDIIYAVLNDGVLVGKTVKTKEDVSGWQRIKMGGTDTKVISISVEPQDEGYDRLYICVERTINSTTVRYHEFLTEPFEGLEKEQFYTGNEDADLAVWRNRVFEEQRNLTYLDSHITFDGSIISGSPTVTPAAKTGSGINFTASSSVFKSSDVGKKIIKKYEGRDGGGIATITAFTSATVVVCTIDSDFDTTDAIAAGSWFLTTNTILNLYHLEGQTVQIIADGALHADKTVSNGQITLDQEAGIVHFGFSYVGIYRSLNIFLPTNSGNSLTDSQNVDDVGIIFSHSIGTKYGTDLYRLQQIASSESGQITDRPPVPFTGVLSNFYQDSWEEGKQIFIVQDQPYPCMVNGINISVEAGER